MQETAAFDQICDLVQDGRPFTGRLVASASNDTVRGYLNLEAWLIKKGYEAITRDGMIRYRFKEQI